MVHEGGADINQDPVDHAEIQDVEEAREDVVPVEQAPRASPLYPSDESGESPDNDPAYLSDISESSANAGIDEDGSDEENVVRLSALVDTTYLHNDISHPEPSSNSDAVTEVGAVLDRLERQLSAAFVMNRTSRASSNMSHSSEQLNGQTQSNHSPQSMSPPVAPVPNPLQRTDHAFGLQQPRLGDWLRLRPRDNAQNTPQFQNYVDQRYPLPRAFRNIAPAPFLWGNLDPTDYQQNWDHGFMSNSPGAAPGYMPRHTIHDVSPTLGSGAGAPNFYYLDHQYETDVEEELHLQHRRDHQRYSLSSVTNPIETSSDDDDDDACTSQRGPPPPVVDCGHERRPPSPLSNSDPELNDNNNTDMPSNNKQTQNEPSDANTLQNASGTSSQLSTHQENAKQAHDISKQLDASPPTTLMNHSKPIKHLEPPFKSDDAQDGNLPNNNDSSASFFPFDLHYASPDSKFETYACQVDQKQGDRSIEIALFSFARPHMRAFHFAWIGFFVAFFTWFAISPLLPEVKESLGLTKEEIWTSSICGVAGTVIFRVIAGPICDKYGARWVMGSTLFISGLPAMATGLVNTAPGLSALRLVIGIAGSAFVTCQYWTSTMFTMEVAGTANSLAAGWGNLGGGVTQIVMGSILFPAFKWLYGETDQSDNDNKTADRAWRSVCIVPGLISMITAFFMVVCSDDSPKGNYRKLKTLGLMPSVSAKKSLQAAAFDFNTWLLFIQYGACFGVELTVSNAAALYFNEEFGQSTESAAAIASVFGWMNLFARGLGGFGSDIMNVYLDMRGRLIFQTLSLVIEGVLIIFFAKANSLGSAILAMACFSLFVQISEGSTFAIVPYVNPPVTGSIAGLIGAGGNAGGVAFALIFRKLDYRKAFNLMGWAVVGTAILGAFISIKGHAGLICGRSAPEVIERHSGHKTNITDQLSNEKTTEKVQDQTKPPCRDACDVDTNEGQE